jgi:hypothetical protein
VLPAYAFENKSLSEIGPSEVCEQPLFVAGRRKWPLIKA